MERGGLAEHWLRQIAAPAPGLAERRGSLPFGRPLLDRAEAAARRAGELGVDWFWLRQMLLCEQAERLSRAAECGALAAHRAGLLWPRRRVSVLARVSRRAPRAPG
jgi:hypothetical protein